MTADALLLTARKHLRLLDQVDGVLDVRDLQLIRHDIGWSVNVTITENDDGWEVMRLLKSAGADLLVVGTDPMELKIGVAWPVSESFAMALMEVVSVEEWLKRMVRP